MDLHGLLEYHISASLQHLGVNTPLLTLPQGILEVNNVIACRTLYVGSRHGGKSMPHLVYRQPAWRQLQETYILLHFSGMQKLHVSEIRSINIFGYEENKINIIHMADIKVLESNRDIIRNAAI